MELHQHECPACHRIYDCESEDCDLSQYGDGVLHGDEIYCPKCYAIVEVDLEDND